MTGLLFTNFCPTFNQLIDKTVRDLNSSGIFSSCTLIYHLSKDAISQDTNLYKAIWKSHVPKKVKFLLWETSHSCINIHDRLQKRCLGYLDLLNDAASASVMENPLTIYSYIAPLLGKYWLICLLLLVGALYLLEP